VESTLIFHKSFMFTSSKALSTT